MARRNRNLRIAVPINELWDRSGAVSDVSVGKSSSSSLSWGEECEHEATRAVKSEYERMQRVLGGSEGIPPNYDRDEYKLWIKMFPCLRSTHAESKQPPKPKIAETRVIDDNSTENATVIEDFNLMCTNSSKTTTKKGTKRLYPLTRVTKNANLDTDFLTISPAVTSIKSPSNNARFAMYLPVVSKSNDASAKATKPRSRRNGRSRNSKFDRKVSPANRLVLPPIDVHRNQFRSISAMPLQQTKSTSAMSTKTSVNFDCKLDVNEKVARRNCKNVKNFYCK